MRKGCAHDVNSQTFVIDDRLYDYIEENIDDPGKMLVHCVKVSQLIRGFTGRDDLNTFTLFVAALFCKAADALSVQIGLDKYKMF